MSTRGWKIGLAGVVMALQVHAQAVGRDEPALSAAQTAIVTTKIARLRGSVDRQVAEGWSNAKKVAELLCRPAALPILKRQTKGVDRVFLGTDAPETLTLESNRRLTGSGQYRTPLGWHDFTFTCDLNPETGKIAGFQTKPLPPQPHQ